MANLEVKSQVIAEVKEKLSASKGVVLTDYRGLTVGEVTKLRTQLREAGVEYKVVKNTFVKRAADEIGLQGLDPFLEGPTAVAYGINDPVSPAKILSEFAKTYKALEIKAGVLEGKVIGVDGVKALAELPSREVLLAQVLGAMQSPLVGMVNVLQGPIRKMGYALEEVRKLKAAQ
ncbi:MAG TPA: 50S ribosomal protein L10 [Candidatus Deferrimicrobium sp.]|nr:50S ribosomal protein L10 [Candidatus Deferrimicrobium sp.]